MKNRKSLRLKGYDYGSEGAYFITICAQNRECLFGEIICGKMKLNQYGKIVYDEWERSRHIRSEIELDQFVIMPNHIHGIVIIVGANGRSPQHGYGRSPQHGYGRSPQHGYGRSPMQMGSKTISSFIAGYKSTVTKQINILRNKSGFPVWQRNYYEHIIRGEEDLIRIREYIINNPAKWNEDKNYINQGSD